MSMFLELSSRMIDYLPEEISRIQRTVEIALTESNSEEEMFGLVDKSLNTKHLREGAREFWDVFSNASDYAEPLTEGFGGFPIDKANVVKNRGKDRNIGRVFDIDGNQVLVVNKRSSGEFVLIDKTGRRMTKKGEAIGATRTEKVELNLLDVIEEEDQSSSESPNPTSKKKTGKTTVVINPKVGDLMKEGNKDYDGDGKVESGAKEHAGAVHNAIQRKKGGKPNGKDTTSIKEESLDEKIDVGANAGKTIKDFVHSKSKTFEGDSKKQRINRALGAYYGAQKEEFELEEGKEELKQRNKNEMQRKAGNLGREVVSSNKGPKRTAAMDRMGKLVKVIARDDEQRRFKTIGQSPAHNSNYKEEFENVDEAIDPKGSRRIQAAIDKNKKPETQDQKDKRLMMGKYSPDKLYKKEEFDIYNDLIEDMLHDGYDEDQIAEVITAIEEGYEVIFEEDGAVINDEVEQLDEEVIDEEFLADVEMVADWLHMEGIIANEDEYFELMDELSEEEIDELYELVLEATAMAKRGKDETAIRNTIAKNTGGGAAADRATALEKQPTYGDANKENQRQKYARAQRGDHRTTASSSPGLRGYGHQSSDPAVKAKQAARGAQRGSAALTPNEKKQLNMGDSYMIGDSLEEGGMEVRTYSWREVMESQGARNNPEKYEADQKKKSAPVRGEKTPMPPRGDKRREDFEKWYAANVR